MTPVNDPPVAVVDGPYATNEDVTLNVAAPGLLANDTDPEGQSLTAVLGTGALHGTATVNADGSFTYVPAANYAGSDSFTYRAFDGTAYSNTVVVAVNVAAVNDPPVAVADSATTAQDTPVTVAVLANDTDIDGGALSVTAVTQPAHGTAAISGGVNVVYTPASGYSGSDSFTYTVSDGNGGTATAAVNLTVSGLGAPATTTLSTTPIAPNGSNGWFKTTPLVQLSTTGDAAYYQWDSWGAGGWTLYTAQFPALSGNHTLWYYSTKSGSSDETTKSTVIKVDSAAPGAPGPQPTTNITDNSATLVWSAASDSGASGIAGYRVYDAVNNVTPTSGTTLNVSGLTGSTSYTYRVSALDNAGNESPLAPITFTTSATPIPPHPYTTTLTPSNITLAFSSITATNTNSATPIASPPAAPGGFALVSGTAHDIQSTTAFTGMVEVTVPYDATGMDLATEQGLRLHHYKNGVWVDITKSGGVDTNGNTITGWTDSFSPFAVFAPTAAPPVSGVPATSPWSLIVLALAGVVLLGPGIRRRVAKHG